MALTNLPRASNVPAPEGAMIKSRPLAATIIMLGGIIALVFGIGLAVSFGAADIPFAVVWDAIFNFNPEINEHQIIQESRLPRVLAGAMVGACFAVSGAIMQGMTRNPLADSGLLGLNAGSGFVIALCFAFFQACRICISSCILFWERVLVRELFMALEH